MRNNLKKAIFILMMIIMLPVTSVGASIHYEDYELPIMGEEVAIISQSSSLNVNVGDIAKYSVKAKGVGLTYQWQVKLKNSASWTNASGNKDTWCFKVASIHDGMQVRCVVKDAIGETAISKAVNCIIDENLKIVSQPGSVEAEVGSKVSYSVAAEGMGLTYQWQVKFNGSANWTNASGKGATWSFTAASAHDGMQVRCIVKDAKGKTVVSETAVCKVVSQLKIVSQPDSVEAEVGSKVSYSVAAEGTGLTYQWQVKFNGSANWTNASGKGAMWSFTAASAHDGMQVRCIVKNVKGNIATSDIAGFMVVQK